ncbi:ribulose 1,5-bisphosphate carboxylase large subunit [Rhodococcus sp. WMMA185]|uniref:ribulose 1,5-bisphosphate carboxylase large subunit n=1 Tax=Rhodococcus sp. WMMA185 TaxID=679318 RepID=UPI000878AFCC|nr:ribulose 1,5-bisphosphate carboxylase large subunit [Rhodococcus sp. WMMA185]AOW91642.1 ribulose 1,5-bisphosphate carboxylase large subunit [Rhodococcus sp. WMMA185]
MLLVQRRPRNLVHAVTDLARYSVDTAGLIVSLPGRIGSLLDQVEALVARIEAICLGAEAAVARANAVANGAAAVVATAAEASASAQALITIYEPLAHKAAPMAERIMEELSEEEIDATIELVNHLPELTLRMEGLIPVLTTLGTVSPEIHQLLAEVRGIRQSIHGVPSFKYFRKRGDY